MRQALIKHWNKLFGVQRPACDQMTSPQVARGEQRDTRAPSWCPVGGAVWQCNASWWRTSSAQHSSAQLGTRRSACSASDVVVRRAGAVLFPSREGRGRGGGSIATSQVTCAHPPLAPSDHQRFFFFFLSFFFAPLRLLGTRAAVFGGLKREMQLAGTRC